MPIGRGQCWTLPRFKDRDRSSVLPRLGKVMGAENRIEDTGEEGNRSLGKMHISGQFTGLIFKGRIVQDEFQEHFGTQLYIE